MMISEGSQPGEDQQLLKLLEAQLNQRWSSVLAGLTPLSAEGTDAGAKSESRLPAGDTSKDGHPHDGAATEVSTEPAYFPLFRSAYTSTSGNEVSDLPLREEETQVVPEPQSSGSSSSKRKSAKSKKDRTDHGTGHLPLVRLTSPSDALLQHGRAIQRIIAEEDEDPTVLAERKARINDIAVDASWIFETSGSHHWGPRKQPSRKLTTRTLRKKQTKSAKTKMKEDPKHSSRTLPPLCIAYLAKPVSSKKKQAVRSDVHTHGKVALKAFPDKRKRRLEVVIRKNTANAARLVGQESRLQKQTSEGTAVT